MNYSLDDVQISEAFNHYYHGTETSRIMLNKSLLLFDLFHIQLIPAESIHFEFFF